MCREILLSKHDFHCYTRKNSKNLQDNPACITGFSCTPPVLPCLSAEVHTIYTTHTTYCWNIKWQKCARMGLNGFHIKCIIGTHCSKKNQNPGSPLGATSWTALPIWPIWPKVEVNGLDWQCCLAGSSKRAPRIFIFFNCHGCQSFILCEIHCY